MRIRPLLLGALIAACGVDRTALLVEVTSADLVAPDDIDALRFAARSEFEAYVDRTFAIAGPWPHSVTIVPPSGERRGTVRITVTGYRRDAFVVRRVIIAAFEPGATRRIVVDLTRACVGIMCHEAADCRAGSCVEVVPSDAGMADAGPFDAGAMDAGPSDAGPMDAGPMDAGPSDAGAMDAGPMDAGPSDAGAMDAGPMDAGRLDGGPSDAGRSDAGPPDAGSPDAGPPPAGLVLNEVDYDQPGTDTAEFVEIYNAGTATASLDGLQVVLVNGATTPAAPYATINLSGLLGPGQFLVVGSDAVLASLPATARGVRLATSIQNGDPDGVALWDGTRRTLLDALSYGGAITMASIGGVTVSLVSGTATSARDSASSARSVCRFPDGTDTGDDAADWTLCATPTAGLPNVR
jgi:hypothetical protein